MTELSSEAIKALRDNALQELSACTTAQQLEAWRVEYIGRKGKITTLLRKVKDVPAAQRQEIGEVGNQARRILEEAFAAHKEQAVGTTTVPQKKRKGSGVTYLASLPQAGHLHPLTLTIRRIQDIFLKLGFTLVEGPQVEDEWHNFDALNIPPTHPTRTEQDTFYLENGTVLRVHTSPVQVRAVVEQKLKPPFRIFSPGRVYRCERTDATHETTFYQFEGLVVGDGATVTEFKGLVSYFYSQFFGKELSVRLRPSYFPFVEPGFEVDMQCAFCNQEGCRICKYSGWVEVMGAGMVHPHVLQNMGLDPTKHHGYAFGGAVDRLAMLQYGIDDIRLFWSGDLRFLKQFS